MLLSLTLIEVVTNLFIQAIYTYFLVIIIVESYLKHINTKQMDLQNICLLIKI